MIHHGQLYLRDHVPPRSRYYERGRFGRLFPTLPPFATDSPQIREALLALGAADGPMDPGDASNPDNPGVPAGFTFLGQFVDHDLTFDPTSSLERQNDPEAIQNFRTPAFELDSAYGSGRAASPHFYEPSDGRVKFLIDDAAPKDLPRNSRNTALIGDPRNDENVIVSQLHLAFLKFHNAMVDQLIADGVTDPNEAFSEAQRLVRWHYQWIVLHEFLPHIVGQELRDEVLGVGEEHTNRRFFRPRHEPFIPVEFSVAAYRFGHSQVRPGYLLNVGPPPFAGPFMDATLDPNDPDPDDLRGGKRAPRRFVEWEHFFEGLGDDPTLSKRIDTTLSSPLFRLPFGAPGTPGGSPGPVNPASLAQRNLLRHLSFSLPSGQVVAAAMGIEPLHPDDLEDVEDISGALAASTPLWFYILRESAVRTGGETLGPVGGRIVAEVFIGLLEDDRMSFMRQNPNWTPTVGSGGTFGMADLLQFAGVA